MKISRPTRPKSAVFTCYRRFLRAHICPFRADVGREKKQDAPQEGAYNSAMRPVKSAQEGTFVWFGARRARKFKFSHFFGLLLRVRSGRPLHIYRPTGCSSTGAAPGLEKCKGDMPMTNVRKNSAKLTREDLKIAPESPTMERQELAVPCEFSVRNSMVISDRNFGPNPCRRTF